MVISDTVGVWTTLDFICLTARRQDPVISTAYDILLQFWEKSMQPVLPDIRP